MNLSESNTSTQPRPPPMQSHLGYSEEGEIAIVDEPNPPTPTRTHANPFRVANSCAHIIAIVAN